MTGLDHGAHDTDQGPTARESTTAQGDGDMPDKGPGSKSGGKKPKGGAKPGDKKKK
jgi:hypothetical protein